MFNNPDMSDIGFTCEGSDKIFYAHKYVLSTTSAVFHAMFYGGLAVKDSVVHLCDTDEESLETFLKFLYTEEYTFTTDNVVGIMYLAKKYIVLSLNEKCVDFLLENLNPGNAFDILELATRFDESKIEKRCWKVIQYRTNKVVAVQSIFNTISPATLYKLLKRDNLNIREADLFRAVLRWIDSQCSLKNLRPTIENRRSVIGRAIYEFRFFGMSPLEFSQVVSKSSLLVADELVPIFEKFTGIKGPALKWKHQARRPETALRFSRFPEEDYNEGFVEWSCSESDVADRLCFSVSEEMLLLGVRLFGNNGSQFQITFEVKDAKVSKSYTSNSDQNGNPGIDVWLKTPVRVKQNEVITLSATVRGPYVCYLANGVSAVTLEGVTVTFTDAPTPNNGSSILVGQFHEIILI